MYDALSKRVGITQFGQAVADEMMQRVVLAGGDVGISGQSHTQAGNPPRPPRSHNAGRQRERSPSSCGRPASSISYYRAGRNSQLNKPIGMTARKCAGSASDGTGWGRRHRAFDFRTELSQFAVFPHGVLYPSCAMICRPAEGCSFSAGSK